MESPRVPTPDILGCQGCQGMRAEPPVPGATSALALGTQLGAICRVRCPLRVPSLSLPR